MTYRERLVEQHVREHESRLRHMDELLARAEQEIGTKAGAEKELDELEILRNERMAYLDHIEQLKQETRQQWQENGIEDVGPMVIWEAIAKRLEELVERVEHRH